MQSFMAVPVDAVERMDYPIGRAEWQDYYATEVNDEYDNPPIGIILCTDEKYVRAEYALGGLTGTGSSFI